MPIKDYYHDLVVHALISDGWKIVKEQMAITTGTRRLFVDICAANRDGLMSLIEVKGFTSPADALAEALGQYLLYQFAIDYADLAMPLYLAVPIAAYRGILTESIGEYARRIGNISLVVFDPDSRRIVEWINSELS